MDHQTLTTNQLRWQTLRPFNIAILMGFTFLFLVGIGQSYSGLSSTPSFLTPLVLPLLIFLSCAVNLISMISKKDAFTQIITPFTCLLIVLFVSINSHLQEHAYISNSLYILLLLPFFYMYLFAHSRTYLAVNNIFLVACYIFSAATGETDAFTFLVNITLLITICYLTIYSSLRIANIHGISTESNVEAAGIITANNGRYLNRIIHDIRQPLSSLCLYGHLLENKLADTPHFQLAKNIQIASEQLERWLSSLLDLARLDNHNVIAKNTDFSLSSTLQPVITKYQLQASTLGIELKHCLRDLSVRTDNRLLSDIVETLLNNALIHGKQQKGSKVLISTRKFQGKVLLQVWNQGQQIAPTIYENLFDEVKLADNPLHNKSKGLGLGLPIAQRKALLCNTKIDVVSNDFGSRFSLALEAADASERHINLATLAHLPACFNILLIDDDPEILNALCMLLENWGYKVDCAETAELGLKKYYATKYDLVITDYRLPNQQTGLDVIKAIKKHNDIPAILLTGEVDPGKLQKEITEPNESITYKVVNKPVKPASLRFLLRQLLT